MLRKGNDTVVVHIIYIYLVSGRIRVIDADTCSEVQCLVEVGAVGSLDIALNEGKVTVAAVTHQTRFNGTTVSKITGFFPRDDDTWERLLPVRDCSPVSCIRLVY